MANFTRHLIQVAEQASIFSRFFGGQKIAYHTCLLHDVGKYSEAFDKRLHGGKSEDHATAGAKIAVERWGVVGKKIRLL